MKFIIDAQLPIKLKSWLVDMGDDAVHTTDLPKKEYTIDTEIIRFADLENRIVITKDSDFYRQYLITSKPKLLLFITMGNISNSNLLKVFELNFETIRNHFESGKAVVELGADFIKVLH